MKELDNHLTQFSPQDVQTQTQVETEQRICRSFLFRSMQVRQRLCEQECDGYQKALGVVEYGNRILQDVSETFNFAQ